MYVRPVVEATVYYTNSNEIGIAGPAYKCKRGSRRAIGRSAFLPLLRVEGFSFDSIRLDPTRPVSTSVDGTSA